MGPKVGLECHHPRSVWHVQEARGFGSLESGLRKHMCRSDGTNGTRTSKVDRGMSRRGAGCRRRHHAQRGCGRARGVTSKIKPSNAKQPSGFIGARRIEVT